MSGTEADAPSFEQLDAALRMAPFHQWLGLRLVSASVDGIEFDMPWRDEIVSNPSVRAVHGGVLAALVDLGGLYAVLACGMQRLATADLRVDYHRTPAVGPLKARSSIIKLGKRLCTAESSIFDCTGKLIASGRGAYLISGV